MRPGGAYATTMKTPLSRFPIITILAAVLGSTALATAAPQVTVPPEGSLSAARDAIRAKRQAGEQGPAIISVTGGRHNVAEPLVLDAQDSDLTISAAKGENPLFLGGSLVTGFTAYQGQILKADVSALVKEGVTYRQLLCDDQRMILARYPNFIPQDPLYGGWAFTDALPPGGEPSKDSFLLKLQDQRKWAHPEDVEVDIYTGDAYWNNIKGFVSHDPTTRVVTLAASGGYGIKPYSRFHFQNALEELDSPGEWFLDVRTKTLYFWPLKELGKSEVRLVTLDSFIQVKAGANNIHIEKLGFTGCNGTAITVTNAEDCLISGCSLTTVGGYHGSKGGFSGAINISGGHHNLVQGNDISYTGGAGIGLSGGDRLTLTPADHQAINNDIHHVGVFGKGSSGIDVGGCGITIAHNLIHDNPRIGVQMGGNKHIVEYNHLYQLCLETNDGGALYTGGRDWIGGRGTVWRYNRIHDVVGCGQTAAGLKHPAFTFGLYPDDNAGGLDMIGNLVYRCGTTPLHMHDSRDCLVENNVLAYGGSHQFDFQGWLKSQKAVIDHLPTMIKGYESVMNQPAWKGMRGMELHPDDSFHDDGTMMSGNVVHRNIMLSNSATAKYAKINNATPKWNTVDLNLVWNGEYPVKTDMRRTGAEKRNAAGSEVTLPDEWACWQAQGWDKNSIVADPMFENPAKDDFRLKPESPAIKQLGFKPLPIDEMGLISDKWRKP